MNIEELQSIELGADITLSKTCIQEIIDLIEDKIIGSEFKNLRKLLGIYVVENCKQPELKPYGNLYKILLTGNCKNDPTRTKYQLAHEFIHLILPSFRKEVNFFEEGIATYFSLDFVRIKGLKAWGGQPYHEKAAKIMDQKYKTAYTDIQQLEKITGKSIYDICKHLISKDLIQSFADVTPELLSEEFRIDDNLEVLKRLCSKFY